jgi:Amt family ammonium transporter
MATLVVWSILDSVRTGHITAVGAATGIVVGLVAITPAAGFVSPAGALALGAIAALPSYFMIILRARTRLDDSLDVFAGHGIGGLTGALLTGVFAAKEWGGTAGLLEGNASQFGKQAIGAGASFVYAGVMTFIILKLLGLVLKLRIESKTEGLGLDVTQHGEEAYSSGEGSILVLPEVEAVATRVPTGVPLTAR